MPATQNIVGVVIREMREKKQLTQTQLTAKINLLGWDISRETLAKIEARLRCVADYEIPVLASSLGISPSELLRLAVEKDSKKARL